MQIPKTIITTAKILQSISPTLAMHFAVKLFITPIKHKIPKRELDMFQKSNKEKILIPKIKKTIHVYSYGNSKRKILLVHGWSGRGTQLVKIADEFLALGFQTISFDAPAHGKSSGRTTIMTEFIASIMEIENKYGPFEFAIGHSLGGMSILNALKQNLKLDKAVIIGSGDIIQDIIVDFVKKLRLDKSIALKMKLYFEKKFGEPMENYAASYQSQSIEIPVLIIHDKNDIEVPVTAAFQIHDNLKNSEIVITEGLGHRKILGNNEVIIKIKAFLQD